MQEPLDEEMLEQLYWEFDAERNKKNRSERDIFKGKMRYFATHGRNQKLPWWQTDRDGWPIELFDCDSWFGNTMRILFQNIRKVIG